MISPAMHERMAANAQIVARKYRKKLWWVSLEDLEQEALLAQYDAAPRFDPERGTPFGVYTYTVAMFACRRHVLTASSPVSCRTEPDKMVGMHRAEYFDETAKAQPRPGMDKQDELVDEKAFATQVRRRLAQLMGEEGVDFAISVFTGEYRAADFAEEHEVPVRAVYSTIKHAKDKISSDPVLYDLWRST